MLPSRGVIVMTQLNALKYNYPVSILVPFHVLGFQKSDTLDIASSRVSLRRACGKSLP